METANRNRSAKNIQNAIIKLSLKLQIERMKNNIARDLKKSFNDITVEEFNDYFNIKQETSEKIIKYGIYDKENMPMSMKTVINEAQKETIYKDLCLSYMVLGKTNDLSTISFYNNKTQSINQVKKLIKIGNKTLFQKEYDPLFLDKQSQQRIKYISPMDMYGKKYNNITIQGTGTQPAYNYSFFISTKATGNVNIYNNNKKDKVFQLDDINVIIKSLKQIHLNNSSVIPQYLTNNFILGLNDCDLLRSDNFTETLTGNLYGIDFNDSTSKRDVASQYDFNLLDSQEKQWQEFYRSIKLNDFAELCFIIINGIFHIYSGGTQQLSQIYRLLFDTENKKEVFILEIKKNILDLSNTLLRKLNSIVKYNEQLRKNSNNKYTQEEKDSITKKNNEDLKKCMEALMRIKFILNLFYQQNNLIINNIFGSNKQNKINKYENNNNIDKQLKLLYEILKIIEPNTILNSNNFTSQDVINLQKEYREKNITRKNVISDNPDYEIPPELQEKNMLELNFKHYHNLYNIFPDLEKYASEVLKYVKIENRIKHKERKKRLRNPLSAIAIRKVKNKGDLQTKIIIPAKLVDKNGFTIRNSQQSSPFALKEFEELYENKIINNIEDRIRLINEYKRQYINNNSMLNIDKKQLLLNKMYFYSKNILSPTINDEYKNNKKILIITLKNQIKSLKIDRDKVCKKLNFCCKNIITNKKKKCLLKKIDETILKINNILYLEKIKNPRRF